MEIIACQIILQISLKLQLAIAILVPLKVAERFFAGVMEAASRLGNGETLEKDHPVLVKMQNADSSFSNLSSIVQITVGNAHACALNQERKVLCWGKNSQGQLGNGVSADDPPNQSYPVYVHESESSSNHLTDIVQVRAGQGIIPALLPSGAWVDCWGQGSSGQLGSSSTTVYYS